MCLPLCVNGDTLTETIMDKAVMLAVNTRLTNEAKYRAMCKGNMSQFSIHRKVVKGPGYAYHGHVNLND